MAEKRSFLNSIKWSYTASWGDKRFSSLFAVIWKKVRDPGRFKGLGNFETSSVHITSSETLRRWFKSSGLRMERLINILPDRAKIAKHVTLGLMDAWLASEIIAVARKT